MKDETGKPSGKRSGLRTKKEWKMTQLEPRPKWKLIQDINNDCICNIADIIAE